MKDGKAPRRRPTPDERDEKILDAINLRSSYSADDLQNVLRLAGFPTTILEAYRKSQTHISEDTNISEDEKASYLKTLYEQYSGVLAAMELIGRPDAFAQASESQQRMRRETDENIFDPKKSASYNETLSGDFDLLQKALNLELGMINEVAEMIKQRQDPYLLEAFRRRLAKPDGQEARGLGYIADARCAFWLTDLISDVHLIDPELRPIIRAFVQRDKKRILGDNTQAKLNAADRFLHIVGQIDGFENAKAYREVIAKRAKMIIELYDGVKATSEQILSYQLPKIADPIAEKPPTPQDLVPEPESPAVEPIITPPELPQPATAVPTSAPSKPTTSAPPKPTPAEVKDAVELAQQQWDREQAEQLRLAAEDAEIERQLAAAEAAELAALERELAELEKAQAALAVPEEVRSVEDNVEKFYNNGDKVGFSDIPKPDDEPQPTDDDLDKRHQAAELIRAKRKFDLKDAASCHGATELVVLKSRDKNKTEVYMVVIPAETSEKRDDIILLDGDSTGTAAYVALRLDLQAAIELAEIHEKANSTTLASEDDILYYMMRNCRTIMLECGIKRIIHHPKTDVALEFDQAIEQLRPPIGEMIIERDN
jgi:hypothetical protein